MKRENSWFRYLGAVWARWYYGHWPVTSWKPWDGCGHFICQLYLPYWQHFYGIMPSTIAQPNIQGSLRRRGTILKHLWGNQFQRERYDWWLMPFCLLLQFEENKTFPFIEEIAAPIEKHFLITTFLVFASIALRRQMVTISFDGSRSKVHEWGIINQFYFLGMWDWVWIKKFKAHQRNF